MGVIYFLICVRTHESNLPPNICATARPSSKPPKSRKFHFARPTKKSRTVFLHIVAQVMVHMHTSTVQQAFYITKKMLVNHGCCYTVMKNAETSCDCRLYIQFPLIRFSFR